VFEVLDAGVGTGVKEALVAGVVPADDVRRSTVETPDLEHLTVAIVLLHSMSLDHDAVTHTGLHTKSSFAPTTMVRFHDKEG